MGRLLEKIDKKKRQKVKKGVQNKTSWVYLNYLGEYEENKSNIEDYKLAYKNKLEKKYSTKGRYKRFVGGQEVDMTSETKTYFMGYLS